ncbi:hypothetical protein BGZ76_000861 [Entomortierella beljakovae]|nr:hypothetical protein BGZ76_000861 [Entomortierella beljakovae]
MTSTKFKNLQDLDLSAGNLDDQSTADVLNAMYEAKAFEIVSSEFSMHSFNSLITRHAPTIRKLGLHYCSQLTGEMVQGILTQCPSLEIFKANRIHGAVLVRIGQVDPSTYDVDAVTLGQDWVCPNLRWLVLSFESGGSTGIIDTKIPRSEREKLMELQRILAQKHVLRQLSRLTELRWLCFKFSEDYLYQTLNLKLKSRGGELDQLSTLKKLERIDLGSEPLDFTEGEIDWMGGNWPYIKTVNGVFNRDYDKNGELETYGNLFYGISTSERSNSFF